MLKAVIVICLAVYSSTFEIIKPECNVTITCSVNPDCPCGGSSANDPNNNPYHLSRLPKALQPELYTLKIKTCLNDDNCRFKFTGEVIITFKVIENTKNITLHAKNLRIDESKIIIRTEDNCIDQAMRSESVKISSKYDFYVIHLSRPLIKNTTYKVELIFEGEITDSLTGFYRSSYFDKQKNTTRWLAVTQFQPTHAREAFPCFDEPEMKAKFDITIGHSKKYKALSNMPLLCAEEMIDNKNFVWSRFEESLRMSTYTVAYCVHDFEYLETRVSSMRDVEIRTWVRPGLKRQAEYVNKITPKVLSFFEEHLKIQYPLKKLDQIAIPDFSAGAMENWGLIIYRESDLLYAESVSSAASKHRITSIVCHEIAHQWFGNLVTMKWWNDLWLNEGFATYIASLGVDHLHPDWNSKTAESFNNIVDIFKHDAMNSSHTVSPKIEDSSKMSFIFDKISYSKGSTILRMMHLFLGGKTFINGIQNYLKKYSFSNTNQNNLWSSITEVGHQMHTLPKHVTIKEIMDSWTLQTGYPVITVTRNYRTGLTTIVQHQFTYNTINTTKKNSCWWIPLTYTSQANVNFESMKTEKWLECQQNKSAPLKINNIGKPNEWVIFNIQLSGLYKVNYDYRNWDLLIDVLLSKEFRKIHVVNRAQIVNDALDLAWTGDLDYKVVIRVLKYLKHEHEYLPWKAAMSNLITINRILSLTSKYGHIIKYMKLILTPVYQAVNRWTNVQQNDKLSETNLMLLITTWSCRFEVADCISKSERLFYKWLNSRNPDKINPIPVDLRSVVYCTTVRNGGEYVWNFLWTRYLNARVATERETILAALACTREVWLLQRYLEWCFDEQRRIRKQDSFLIFSSIARTDVGFCVSREYFFQNFEAIYKYYSTETSKISELIQIIAERMYSSAHIKMMKEFAAKHKKALTKVNEGVERSFEKMDINCQWMERNYRNISRYLVELTSNN